MFRKRESVDISNSGQELSSTAADPREIQLIFTVAIISVPPIEMTEELSKEMKES